MMNRSMTEFADDIGEIICRVAVHIESDETAAKRLGIKIAEKLGVEAERLGVNPMAKRLAPGERKTVLKIALSICLQELETIPQS